jgi:hypothetical protein
MLSATENIWFDKCYQDEYFVMINASTSRVFIFINATTTSNLLRSETTRHFFPCKTFTDDTWGYSPSGNSLKNLHWRYFRVLTFWQLFEKPSLTILEGTHLLATLWKTFTDDTWGYSPSGNSLQNLHWRYLRVLTFWQLFAKPFLTILEGTHLLAIRCRNFTDDTWGYSPSGNSLQNLHWRYLRVLTFWQFVAKPLLTILEGTHLLATRCKTFTDDTWGYSPSGNSLQNLHWRYLRVITFWQLVAEPSLTILEGTHLLETRYKTFTDDTWG